MTSAKLLLRKFQRKKEFLIKKKKEELIEDVDN